MAKNSIKSFSRAISFLFSAIFFSLFSIILLASPSSAATTLTVGPTLISANQPLAPGENYTLPAYTVSNGSGREVSVEVTAFNYRDRERSLPPSSWFEFSPASLKVPAGESRQVYVRVNLPHHAQPGNYRIWFKFHGSSASEPAMLASNVALYVSFVFDVSRGQGFQTSEPGRSPETGQAYKINEGEPAAAEYLQTAANSPGPGWRLDGLACWALAAAAAAASLTLVLKLKWLIKK